MGWMGQSSERVAAAFLTGARWVTSFSSRSAQSTIFNTQQRVRTMYVDGLFVLEGVSMRWESADCGLYIV